MFFLDLGFVVYEGEETFIYCCMSMFSKGDVLCSLFSWVVVIKC